MSLLRRNPGPDPRDLPQPVTLHRRDGVLYARHVPGHRLQSRAFAEGVELSCRHCRGLWFIPATDLPTVDEDFET